MPNTRKTSETSVSIVMSSGSGASAAALVAEVDNVLDADDDEADGELRGAEGRDGSVECSCVEYALWYWC